MFSIYNYWKMKKVIKATNVIFIKIKNWGIIVSNVMFFIYNYWKMKKVIKATKKKKTIQMKINITPSTYTQPFCWKK